MAILLKKLTSKQELDEMEELERKIWSDDSVIPLHMTLTVAKFGGLFLGAYDGEKMIGFLYSFPGFTDGQPHLCSHMLGFLPEYRKQGLGVAMKWLQREESRKLGHAKITWTFDPLETVNGYLNIHKLGGIVRSYLPNCYGELNDEMNRGLPTDRFLVEWFIDSNRVERYQQTGQEPIPWETIPQILPYQVNGQGLPVPADSDRTLADNRLLLAVPAHFQAIKRTDFALAAAWRQATGALFPYYFDKGYCVTEVGRHPVEPVVFYLLERQPLDQLLA
ncbi:GNAT family N-acetyltransferase [Brevibacillus fulvus]|uniref:GNAT superfamily acetyltransferase n=1 Tax=Brevibacillus fulvus TaxID=1125967 RepID=A0A939BPS3_9BACL|nr:GNAT family N-acetyltransferase [Brevibacillus fulvus]MBM7590805.1 putative GNAT superfamily acetyltransferase [Brevibacillus fulvus]